ncbi:hypothetical protein L226DRAFT_528177 [Lentinus tigrinus ALCF2SS1-7]|uniref:uncharacterized protein n=1 Tax=Lentinus tigrinus ALCF2SS1-7 TaxID=1328758 RepID=UPI001165CC84|nr:hypothetical protein L226DRAFT_528177 [Lentinus tigrinus ALCF2SS1-7]
MSLSLARQARLAQSLSIARRSVSRCQRFAALATQPRHEPESQDPAPVAGPSHADASTASSSSVEPAAQQDENAQELFARVQSYLAAVNESGIEPTLGDLDAYKPAVRPPIQSPKYVEQYNDLINTLCRSFTKQQLRKFLVEALGPSRHCATSRKKTEYAESILEQLWKWPTLGELERARRDKTEVTERVFSVTSSELFLFLGRDGSDLLRMAQDYNVHISLRQRPLGLQVDGARASVRELSEHLLAIKQNFVEEKFTLPSPVPIPPDMIQRISRLAQAYLANVASSPGTIRICARDKQSLEAAKRLASRVVQQNLENWQTPVLAHLPPGSATNAKQPLVMFRHSYALYPYMSPRPLPLTLNPGSTFRMRRVGEWLKSGFEEDVNITGGLASEQGHILTENESLVSLRDVARQALPEPSRTTVSASLGHILLTRVSKDQRVTLVPPLTGDHPIGKIRQWIAAHPVKMSFVPDLPNPLLSTAPTHQKMLHRLVYHSLPDERAPTIGEPHVSLNRRKVIVLEAALAEPRGTKAQEPDTVQDALDSLQSPDDEVAPANKAPPEPSFLVVADVRCTAGVEADVNVLMPDRPMDLQLTMSSSADLPESQQPPALQKYSEDLSAFLSGSESHPDQPTPPLIIVHDHATYLLHSNVSVRQSVEVVSDSGRPTLRDVTDENLTQALCESTLDLESNQKSMRCHVTCEDLSSDEAWKRFLTDCDRLSLMTHHSTAKASLFEDQSI